MTRREEMQRARLREIARNMKTRDRTLRREAAQGHGPVLQSWIVGRAEAEKILDIMMPKGDEK